MTELERLFEFLDANPALSDRFAAIAHGGDEDAFAQMAAVAKENGFAVTEQQLEAEAVRIATLEMREPSPDEFGWEPGPELLRVAPGPRPKGDPLGDLVSSIARWLTARVARKR